MLCYLSPKLPWQEGALHLSGSLCKTEASATKQPNKEIQTCRLSLPGASFHLLSGITMGTLWSRAISLVSKICMAVHTSAAPLSSPLHQLLNASALLPPTPPLIRTCFPATPQPGSHITLCPWVFTIGSPPPTHVLSFILSIVFTSVLLINTNYCYLNTNDMRIN